MTTGLRVLFAGPSVTLQDGGRRGWLRFGVSGSGPMDRLAHAIANRSVGMPTEAAAVEVSLGGAEFSAEGGAMAVAIVGGQFDVRLDGRVLPPAVLVTLEPGAALSIRPGSSGAWCYLAIAGQVDVPQIMGSVATHTRSGLGGIDGRALAAGDYLPIRPRVWSGYREAEIDAPKLHPDAVRVVFGPQDDYFDPEQRANFLRGPWIVSGRSDRMAYLLEGEPLRHAKSFNIVSDAVVMGAVQVPGDGLPIVLMADRQTTGGYPKIATVIGADFANLAQLRPGASFTFTAVSIHEAVEARRAEQGLLIGGAAMRPLVRTDLSSEFLLSTNLIGGVSDASAGSPEP